MKRDTQNGKLGGVCAGLAKSSGIDTTLIRVLCLIGFIVLFPIAEIVYVALWALMPKE